MDPVNLLVSLIPIVGGVATEVTTLIASLKAAAAANGYDLDTQALTARHAEDVKRAAIAEAEASAKQ
jgi:hypothetical protein